MKRITVGVIYVFLFLFFSCFSFLFFLKKSYLSHLQFFPNFINPPINTTKIPIVKFPRNNNQQHRNLNNFQTLKWLFPSQFLPWWPRLDHLPRRCHRSPSDVPHAGSTHNTDRHDQHRHNQALRQDTWKFLSKTMNVMSVMSEMSEGVKEWKNGRRKE